MAYEKQTWTTGEVITQEKLNHMEDGIAEGSGVNIEFIKLGETQTYASSSEHRFAINNGSCAFSGTLEEVIGDRKMIGLWCKAEVPSTSNKPYDVPYIPLKVFYINSMDEQAFCSAYNNGDATVRGYTGASVATVSYSNPPSSGYTGTTIQIGAICAS